VHEVTVVSGARTILAERLLAVAPLRGAGGRVSPAERVRAPLAADRPGRIGCGP